MKTLSKLKFALLAVLLLGISVAVSSQAFAGGLYVAPEKGTARIDASQTIDSSAYLAGESVVVEGTVNGDLYCAGGNITVKGTINGDVICAGANLTVSGKVNGDVRLAGSNVTLGGEVTGNATVAGSSITTDVNFKLGGDLSGGAASATIDGAIARDMLLGASSLTLSGTVGRDVDAGIENVTFGDRAKIAGNLNYQSSAEVSVPQGVVGGKVNYSVMKNEQINSKSDMTGFGIVASLSFVALSLFAVLVAPKFVHGAGFVSWRRMLLGLLAGFAFVVLTPIVAVLFMVTGVGALIGIALVFSWLLVMILSGAIFAYFVGKAILRDKATNAFAVAAVGALILGFLLWIPFLNALTFLVALFAGVGLQILQLAGQFDNKPYAIEPDVVKKKAKA